MPGPSFRPATWQSRVTLACRLLFALAIALTCYLAFWPVQSSVGGSDKLSHILCFLVLSLLLDNAHPARVFDWRSAAALLLFGAFIECVQFVLPHRQFSLFDFAADALGVGLYAAVAPVLLLLPGVAKYRNSASGWDSVDT